MLVYLLSIGLIFQKTAHHGFTSVPEWRCPGQNFDYNICAIIIDENPGAKIEDNDQKLIDHQSRLFIADQAADHEAKRGAGQCLYQENLEPL